MAIGQFDDRPGSAPRSARGLGDACSHSALLYEGERQFLDAAIPFLEAGFDAGSPALVTLPHERCALLDTHFGPSAGALLTLVPIEDLGQNPAWIIPAIVDFAVPHLSEGRAVRGIGEPVHTGRTAPEIEECERHESLVDLALDGAGPYDILCPYDVGALSPEAIAVAGRTHSHVVTGGERRQSEDFIDSIPTQLSTPLSPIPAIAESIRFGRDDAWSIRGRIASSAAGAGLDGERLEDLAVVVSEALGNSVEHGGGGGEIAWWSEPDRFLFEIRDQGTIADPLVGRIRPAPVSGNGRGMWLMHQLCDLVQIRVDDDGRKTIRLHLAV